MTDGVGNVSTVVTGGVYDPLVSNTLTFEGMELQISGTPVGGEQIDVAATAAGANTNLTIFDTLDGLIAALADPMQAAEAKTAKFLNTLVTAIQRIDVNYNNVITARASVGASMNTLDEQGDPGATRGTAYSTKTIK